MTDEQQTEYARRAVPIGLPHLIAHVVNVPSEPAIEFEVAVFDGVEWVSSGYHHLTPFWWLPLSELSIVSEGGLLSVNQEVRDIPDGWLDHLHEEAIRYAAMHKEPATQRPAFLTSLLAKPPRASIPRRGL